MRKLITLLALSFILGLSTEVAAQGSCGGFTPTIWAAPTDQGTGDGSSRTNAMDLPTVISTLSGTGNRVCLRSGIYTAAATSSADDPAFAISDDGSAIAPNIFVCEHQATDLATVEANSDRCEFRLSGGVTFGNNNGPVIGVVDGTDHVHFYGFYFNKDEAAYGPDAGMIRLVSGSGLKAYNNVIDDGISCASCDGDNFATIFMEDCDDCVVQNNWVRNGYYDNAGNPNNQNKTFITIYGSKRFIISNNYCQGVNDCIFVKGSNGLGVDAEPFNDGTIEYNWCEVNTTYGFGCVTVDEVNSSRGLDIRHNVFKGSSNLWGGWLLLFRNDATAPNNVRAYNNTFVGGGFVNMSTNPQDITFRDNVIAFLSSTSFKAVDLTEDEASTVTVTPEFTFNRNCYFESGASVQFEQNSNSYTALTQWQAVTGSPDPNSVETNPNFTNAGSNNYRLASGSCTTVGTGGVPAGAYVTGSEVIGLQASGGSSSPINSKGKGRSQIRIKAEN